LRVDEDRYRFVMPENVVQFHDETLPDL